MSKRLSQVAFVLVLFLFSSCANNIKLISIQERGELIVAMDEEMPGYFLLGGESYGYQYDLFKAYAEYLGVSLRVVSGNTPSNTTQMLQDGEIDLLATLSDRVDDVHQATEIPIYNTSYVLLSSRKKAVKVRKQERFDLLSFVREGKLLVSSGFKATRAYSSLLDSLSGGQMYVSSRNSFELIESVGAGEYDFLICEMSEAQLGCALMRNVQQVYTFSESVSLSAVVSRRNPELKADFRAWLDLFRTGEEYALLNDLYFKRGIVAQVMGAGLTARSRGTISPYDELFKNAAEDEGYDWRLISAIAYNESRFNPFLISPKGATGIMQVMPRVARQFGEQGSLINPERNIILAIKVLSKIEKSLCFVPETSKADRLQIVLACYNAGLGHVLDARNLARKHGANPDAWADVSHYLKRKADPEVANDVAVKCGRFNSSETLAFVDRVTTRYETYCKNVKR